MAATKEWENGSVVSVTTDGTRALCNVSGGALIALEPATGETLWQYDADGGAFMLPLPVGDLDRGHAIWRFEGGANFAPPFVYEGRLYAGCLDGHVYCFEPQPE